MALKPAQPRDAAHAYPGECGERKDPRLCRLGIDQVPTDKQVKTFNELASSGGKVTAAKIKEKRQEAHEATGQGGPVPRNLKQLRTFLEGKTGPADPGHKLAAYVLDYLAGKKIGRTDG